MPAHCLQASLAAIEDEHPTPPGTPEGEHDGRIGDVRHAMLTTCGAGVLRIDNETCEVESRVNFGSAMATVGVIAGKWMCAFEFSVYCAESMHRTHLRVAGAPRVRH